MILSEFAEFLKKKLTPKTTPVDVLGHWFKQKLSIEPESNVEKIIHTEIGYWKDENGQIFFVGKSETGENLIAALYHFALSFDQQNFNRWLHRVKASDFHFTDIHKNQ